MFFLDEPLFEDHDSITVYYNGTFEGQENPCTFSSISSFMQENQIELVPVVMLAEPEFMYCANSRKMISILENSDGEGTNEIKSIFRLTQILKNPLSRVFL